MDEQRREKVRERYNAKCGYCEVHETDTGATLTIDHHRPLAYGGTENDENLVYCCPQWLLHIQFSRKQWMKLNVKPKQLKKTR